MATKPPLLKAIFANADRIAPNRSRASDGWLGDAAHAARTSDHNPDYRGIVHAADVTHSPDRGFDSYGWGESVRQRCASGAERRVKYLVSWDPNRKGDILASPNTGWAWKYQGGSDHKSHLHISIYSGAAVENSTDDIFVGGPATPGPVPPPVVIVSGGLVSVLPVVMPREKAGPIARLGNQVAHYTHNDTHVIGWNGASLAGDFPFLGTDQQSVDGIVPRCKAVPIPPGTKVIGISYLALADGSVRYDRIVAYANNGDTYIFECT